MCWVFLTNQLQVIEFMEFSEWGLENPAFKNGALLTSKIPNFIIQDARRWKTYWGEEFIILPTKNSLFQATKCPQGHVWFTYPWGLLGLNSFSLRAAWLKFLKMRKFIFGLLKSSISKIFDEKSLRLRIYASILNLTLMQTDMNQYGQNYHLEFFLVRIS